MQQLLAEQLHLQYLWHITRHPLFFGCFISEIPMRLDNRNETEHERANVQSTPDRLCDGELHLFK